MRVAAGAALLLGNDAALKYLTQSYPTGQVIFLRQAAMLVVIVPYIMIFTGWSAARVTQWPAQTLRSVLLLGSIVFMVSALSAVFSNPPRPVEGLFRLPTAPGLGLDIDEAALAQRRVELPGS